MKKCFYTIVLMCKVGDIFWYISVSCIVEYVKMNNNFGIYIYFLMIVQFSFVNKELEGIILWCSSVDNSRVHSPTPSLLGIPTVPITKSQIQFWQEFESQHFSSNVIQFHLTIQFSSTIQCCHRHISCGDIVTCIWTVIVSLLRVVIGSE